jgi:monovalent cation/hydrogen antiporter
MPANTIHAVELVFLLLLLFVVVFAALANKWKLPYPIVLVIAGLFLSFIPGIPRVSINPEIIFLVVLPPLLHAAAWFTSWRDFSHNIVSIALLAFGLVAFTVFGIAEAAHWSFAPFDRRLGFVLGAVVATTDAIAATSIANRLGLPQRIVTVLEGESLINDATGLLALEFGVAMVVQGQTPTVGAGLIRLLYLVVIGTAIGLAIALIVERIERYLDDGPIEVTLSIMVPYATYLAAEFAHSSGVFAVVVCGLYLSRRSNKFFSANVRLQAFGFWNAFTFAVNGLVFVLIGLQLPFVLVGIRDIPFPTLLLYAALFSALVIVLRLIWIYPGTYLAYFIRSKILRQTDPCPSKAQIFVVGWTGMRGVIALAAALSLPEFLADGSPFPQRNLILFLTFCVIFVTLVLQGLSLPPLIRALGLAGTQGPDCEEETARRIILETALNHLEDHRNKHRQRLENQGPSIVGETPFGVRRIDAAFDKSPTPRFPSEAQEAARTTDASSPPAQLTHQVSDHLAEEFEDIVKHYRHRLATLTRDNSTEKDHHAAAHAKTLALSLELVRIERETAIRLRNENRINDEVLRQIERELDLTETRLGTKLPH